MNTINTREGEKLVYDLKRFIKDKRFRQVGLTGIAKLDTLLGGFETGKIYTLVAAPGVGKTMLGIQIFHETLLKHGKCLYISTEMVAETLVARMLTRLTGVPERTVLRDEVFKHIEGTVNKAMNELHELFTDTKPIISDNVNELSQLVHLIKTAISEHGVEMIILDHFHNIKNNGGDYKSIVEAAHEIQEQVISNNVSFVCFAQMSKADVKSNDTETKMARGASDLLDVSDVFVVLDRKRIKSKSTDNLSEMKISVTKNRWDETGSVMTNVEFPRKIIVESQDDNSYNF